MHLRFALVTYLQTPKAIEPAMCPFYNPAVTAQPLAAVHTAAGNAVTNAPFLQSLAQSLTIVAFVRMHSGRTAQERNGVNRLDQHAAVRNVRRRVQDRQRQTIAVYHKMAFRSLFATIRRVGPRFVPPFGAATDAESTEARSQSMRPASSSLSSSVSCSLCQTPAFCQSLRRRQQVTPLPQPI